MFLDLLGFMGLAALGMLELAAISVFVVLLIIASIADRRGIAAPKWWILAVGLAAVGWHLYTTTGLNTVAQTVFTFGFWKPILIYVALGIGYAFVEFMLTIRRGERRWAEAWQKFKGYERQFSARWISGDADPNVERERALSVNMADAMSSYDKHSPIARNYRANQYEINFTDIDDDTLAAASSAFVEADAAYKAARGSGTKARSSLSEEVADDAITSTRNDAKAVVDELMARRTSAQRNVAVLSETLANFSKSRISENFPTSDFFTGWRGTPETLVLQMEPNEQLHMDVRINRKELTAHITVWTMLWPAYLISLVLQDLIVEIAEQVSAVFNRIGGRIVRMAFSNTFSR